MKFVIALVLVATVVMAAESNYVFRANSSHVLRATYKIKPGDPKPVGIVDKDDNVFYLVYVTKDDMKAGWTNVPQVVKDDALAAAEDLVGSMDEKVSKIDKAVALALLQIVNSNRVLLGQSEVTPAQFKALVKQKY